MECELDFTEHTMVIFLNIDGAFNNINPRAIIATLPN